jgi:ring-1,2-phenylacetyl-CoA epoxidase subunit PaaD
MTTFAQAIIDAVYSVSDPELAGVSIGDLGLVRSVEVASDGSVSVVLVPTFLGCPALHVIQHDVEAAAARHGAVRVISRFDHSIPWTTERVSEGGRRALASYGIAVVSDGVGACPFCNSLELRELSPVGPAACRSSWWCDNCRNSVELFRDSRPSPVSVNIGTPAHPLTPQGAVVEGHQYAHL